MRAAADALFCTLWTVAIRSYSAKYEKAFADRRAELRAFRAGVPAPATVAGKPPAFTEEELDWAIAKNRRSGVFVTVMSWLLAGWFLLVDASIPTVGFALVLAVGCTAALVRWLRRLPELREKAREQLQAFVAPA